MIMHNVRTIRNAVLLVVLTSIGGTMIVFSRLPVTADTAAAQSETLLTLEISTGQRRFLQREPIPLKFKLSNQTPLSIGWTGTLDFDRHVNLIMRSEGGVENKWTGAERSVVHAFGSGDTMDPGKSKEVSRLIGHGFVEQLFPQPGRYHFHAEFIYSDFSSGQRERKMISSDPILIEIAEPTGRERLAHTYLQTVIVPERDNWRLDERIPGLRYFTNNFRDSAYWKYIAYELGNVLMEKEQYQAAEDVFYDISDIDFFHSKRVDQTLSLLAGKLKRGAIRTRRVPDPSTFPTLTFGPPYVPAPGPPPAHIPPPVRVPVPTPTPENLPEG